MFKSIQKNSNKRPTVSINTKIIINFFSIDEKMKADKLGH